MKNDDFKSEFIKIARKGWIKGANNTINSAGITFENQLEKKADSMYFPDYKGLEIKTSTRYSNYPFSLFSLAFDGPNLFEMNRVLQKYGKNDFKYRNRKIIIGDINTKKPEKLTNYSFMLDMDKINRKLYLSVFDADKNLIEKKSYIDFDTITKRINVKLNNLVTVYASKKKINDELYFRYYKYIKYVLKNDVDFFELIENNIIKVQIICRVSRSGTEEGRQRNKGLVFQIEKNDIEKMYNCVDSYNEDTLSNNFSIINV